MTHRNFFHRAAIATVVAVLSTGAISAEAAVTAGNYQTHKLPSTTRHSVDQTDSVHVRDPRDYRVADSDTDRVQAGNYQDHVLPSTTRRSPTVEGVRHDRDVAVNNGSVKKVR